MGRGISSTMNDNWRDETIRLFSQASGISFEELKESIMAKLSDPIPGDPGFAPLTPNDTWVVRLNKRPDLVTVRIVMVKDAVVFLTIIAQDVPMNQQWFKIVDVEWIEQLNKPKPQVEVQREKFSANIDSSEEDDLSKPA
jgi:hypothetical protein